MTTEIIKTSSRSVEEICNMSKDQLEQYAENKSKEILSLIQESCEKVAYAKRDAEYAEGIKIGWFGRSKAKTDAVASALLRTNEAVAELTNLQKEIITFTCVTAEFAHVMHQTMARLMATGFRDVNGNLRQLDENSQEFVQHVLDEADKFVKNQKAFESKLNKQAESINVIAKIAEDNRKRLTEKDDVDKQQEALICRNRDSIRENKEKNVLQDKELGRQAAKDDEHDKRLSAKDDKDAEHDKRLDDLSIHVKKLESTIIPLWMKITVITSFVLSVISIFISLAKF